MKPDSVAATSSRASKRRDTKGWTSEQTVGRLKGPRGTFVNISLRRAGHDKLIDLRVRRDEVHIPTVAAAVMLDDTTGYIKLTEFAENSDRELGRALGDLTKRGMKRLVFDLRGNPGGQLDQAILISSRFLPRATWSSTPRGPRQRIRPGLSRAGAQRLSDAAMITLVNRSSASASEIVSGALQDHDSLARHRRDDVRQGVGAVGVSAHTAAQAALITTARYYTPSGRLIQRPWDGTFDDYLTYTLRIRTRTKRTRPRSRSSRMRAARCIAAAASNPTGASTARPRVQPGPVRADDHRARTLRRLRAPLHPSGRYAHCRRRPQARGTSRGELSGHR
jgi:hypothetical protein